MLNLLLIKFNLLVRLFNVLIKTSNYFINHKISKNIILCYYLFNIICFIVLVSLVNYIEINLINYDLTIGEHAQIYTYLFSVIIAMIYLEHTVTDNIEINKVKMNTISKFFSILFIFSLSFTIFTYVANIINPILCEPTSSDNSQTNQNNQNSNISTNEQANGNQQTSSIINESSSNSTNLTSDRINTQTNNQININNQLFTNENPSSSVNNGLQSNNNNKLIVNGKFINPLNSNASFSYLINNKQITGNVDDMLIKTNYGKINTIQNFRLYSIITNSLSKYHFLDINKIFYTENFINYEPNL